MSAVQVSQVLRRIPLEERAWTSVEPQTKTLIWASQESRVRQSELSTRIPPLHETAVVSSSRHSLSLLPLLASGPDGTRHRSCTQQDEVVDVYARTCLIKNENRNQFNVAQQSKNETICTACTTL